MEKLTLVQEENLKNLEAERDIILFATCRTWNDAERHIVNVSEREGTRCLSVCRNSMLRNTPSNIEMVVDGGDLCAIEYHHDASNTYIYRELRWDVPVNLFNKRMEETSGEYRWQEYFKLTEPLYWRVVEEEQMDKIESVLPIERDGKCFQVVYEQDGVGNIMVDYHGEEPIRALADQMEKTVKNWSPNDWIREVANFYDSYAASTDYLSALDDARKYEPVLRDWAEKASRLMLEEVRHD